MFGRAGARTVQQLLAARQRVGRLALELGRDALLHRGPVHVQAQRVHCGAAAGALGRLRRLRGAPCVLPHRLGLIGQPGAHALGEPD